MNRPTIAILASGEGTTAEAVIIASARKRVNFTVSVVVASKKNAGVFKRVSDLNTKYDANTACLLATNDEEINNILHDYQPDLIVLMGYMKKIGPGLVRKYGWRSDYAGAVQSMLLNTHPGLLPATKGLYGANVQQYVLDHRLPEAGQSLHVVSENYDEGPVVAEHKISVHPDDTATSLFDRVKITEKQYLPGDIEIFLQKRQKYLENK